MSMINPTISAASQFINPFDILPNVLYIKSNPTISSPSQFINPFDILPNVLYTDTNPTTNNTTQFAAPFNALAVQFGSNPTLQQTQFIKPPFDILPNKVYPNVTINNASQFKKPFDILPNEIYPNPTKTKSETRGKRPLINFGIDSYDKQSNVPTVITSASLWQPQSVSNTNITLETIGSRAAAFTLSSAGGFTGIPYVSQVGQSLFGNAGDDSLSGKYVTLTLDQLKPFPGVLYSDFRSRLGLKNESEDAGKATLSYIASKRLDGASAIPRLSWKGAIYAGASASPLGAYSVFNIEAVYGWGEHDNPNAIRSDFTLRSHVATQWRTSAKVQKKTGITNAAVKGEFIPTQNPLELATPFRGDKITVIDFSRRKLIQTYDWKRTYLKGEKAFGKAINRIEDFTDLTQDFIKFYFTGPLLQNGLPDAEDDIIVFRAIITSFSENFQPGWTDVQMIGRADPNYTYTGVTRDLTVDFDIYATDRDELKPIYRKLNALAGYTSPTYLTDSIAMQAPWMRITIGDMFVQTPVVMTSLRFTYDTEASWEINIEGDPTMMQVPRKISVSCGFNIISDYLPQRNGRFWSLAKKFEASGQPKAGNDNWLSDFYDNIDETILKPKKVSGKGNTITTENLTAQNNTVNNVPAGPEIAGLNQSPLVTSFPGTPDGLGFLEG
jgi:hypothetical protein